MLFQLSKKCLPFFFVTLFFALSSETVFSASLYIKPSDTEVSVGDIARVQVVMNTGGKIINNADSIIRFPTELLEVVSVDSQSSIFQMWVVNPQFSNSAGTVSFNGGVPNPGFQGSAGKIISIIFRTKKAGTASLIFGESAVRENDGLGTDILENQQGATIVIGNKEQDPATSVPITQKTIVAPQKVGPMVSSPVASTVFSVKVDNGGDPTNPTPSLIFSPKDLSSADHFEITVGNGEPIDVAISALKANSYTLPVEPSGKSLIVVKAVNKDGTSTVVTAEINIKSLEPPTINDGQKSFTVGDTLVVRGTSKYAEAVVAIYVQQEGGVAVSDKVKTDNYGNWSYAYPKSLEKGVYQMWAQVTDKRGAESSLTNKVTITTTLPSFLAFGQLAMSYLTVIVTLFALLALVVLIMFYLWFRIAFWRRKMKKKAKELDRSVITAFDALISEVSRQIEYLDGKKGLTQNEKKVRDNLKEALNTSKIYVSDAVKDVEKEI